MKNMKTFDQELLEHIEFLNLLAMSEDDDYEKKQMMKLIVEMTKELNHEVVKDEISY